MSKTVKQLCVDYFVTTTNQQFKSTLSNHINTFKDIHKYKYILIITNKDQNHINLYGYDNEKNLIDVLCSNLSGLQVYHILKSEMFESSLEKELALCR